MKKLTVIGLLFMLISSTWAQYAGRDFSLSINANYTTTAKVYTNPNSNDINLRNRSIPLEDLLSPSIDLRIRLSESLLLGLTTEWIEKIGSNEIFVQSNSGSRSVTVSEGFKVLPVELSIHYLVPFSTNTFKFLIGGGLAYYYGSHIRRLGGEDVSNIKRDFAYGIQVGISSDYLVTPFLSIRGEMKFRDPEFSLTSKYNQESVIYNGQRVWFVRDEFDSKVNVDGVTFILGIAFHF